MNKTVGATLLIAGCCVGAGMLGIPVVTGPAGFIPSVTFFFIAWIFMMATGLLFAKLALSMNLPEVNVLSMAKATLGMPGKIIAWVLYAFLFYALMTAYVIAGSVLISEATGVGFLLSSLALVAGLYAVIARGVRLVDAFNRYLMIGMIVFYFLLVGAGLPSIQFERLVRQDFSMAWVSLPILVISFGYHNLIGSLVSYLKRDAKALYKAIIFGSFIPLVIYVVWEFVIFGLVPDHNMTQWLTAEKKGELVTQVLADTVGSKSVLYFSQGFAFFAIATSFLPVAFSFVDFLKDGFSLLGRRLASNHSALLVLAPPLLLSISDPSLFLDALDFAGGVCAVTLFGIMPAIMAFKRKLAHKALLAAIFGMSCLIFTIELLHQLGHL